MKDAACVELLRWALPRLGLRWEGFRKPRGQVCKRIDRRVAELELAGSADYRRLLEEDPDEWDVLAGLCRVTISRFFRDRGVWRHLGDAVLPSLAERTDLVRAWSAGCGSGEEPYSLSILWELDVAPRVQGSSLRIVATDAGRDVLARARRACYGRGTLKEMEAGWIDEAFERVQRPEREDEPLCLRRRFRAPVGFRRQDIRERMPSGPFHLVLCRNMAFTYFAPDVQARVLRRLLERLEPGGRLVLGAHESLPPGAWPLRRETRSEPVFVKDGWRPG